MIKSGAQIIKSWAQIIKSRARIIKSRVQIIKSRAQISYFFLHGHSRALYHNAICALMC